VVAEVREQGQGPTTRHKERIYGSIFKINRDIAKRICKRFPYIHVDLNSGSGYNEDRKCDGSPVVFHDLVASGSMDFRMIACDIDPQAVDTLRSRELAGDNRVDIVCCDNKEIFPLVEQRIRETQGRPYMATGSVVLDPNGYLHRKQTPVDELMAFAQKYPRMDMILNLNIRDYLRVVGLRAKPTSTKWHSMFWPHPKELPELFHREFGLVAIRKPVNGTGDAFITLVMRNYQAGDHQKLGLYDFTRDTGKQMLTELRDAGQLSLF
jgi:hypothetical protein